MVDLLHATDTLVSPQSWPATRRLGLRRQEAVFEILVSALDAVVLLASFWMAYALRNRLGPGPLLPFEEYLWILAMAVPIWLALGHAFGLSASPTYRRVPLLATFKVHVIAALVLLSSLYLLKAVEVSRFLMQTFVLVSAAAFAIERAAIRAAMRAAARRWTGAARQMLIVGPPFLAVGLDRYLKHRPHWGARVAGVVTETPDVETLHDVPVLGGLADLDTLLDAHVFDEVVMVAAGVEREYADRVVSACLERGLTYHTLVRMPGNEVGRHHAEILGDGVYLLSLEATPQSVVALSVKRAVDIVVACVGLVVCGLAYLVVAPLIRLESSGPVIFSQTRIGRNGRRFTIRKFRTMRSDAEQQRALLLPANEMRGCLFKLRYDPRVTLVGRILRRIYLDELPQFWNVLKGEMSLVGTRPPMPDEVACYMPHHRRRLSMQPGITGLWQCLGNGRITDFDEVVRLDCEYIDHWSLWMDLKILARTCLTVVRLAGQ